MHFLDKCAAPDQWGYYNEHWAAIVDDDPKETILGRLIPKFINDIMPPDARRRLNGTRGVALNKSGGTDLRPIGMATKLRLIATSYSNSLHTNKLVNKDTDQPVEGLRPFKDFFLPHGQYAIGVPGGLEAMVHCLPAVD